VWIILFLLLFNAQSNELISHRFYCVTVSDFDLILYDLLYSLDFTGLLSESQSGFVIQVTHVVVLYFFMCLCVAILLCVRINDDDDDVFEEHYCIV